MEKVHTFMSFLWLYSPIILKNILPLLLQDFVKFECNTTSDLAKPYGLANQKLCYIQMLLIKEISGEQAKERSQEWLVNVDPGHCKN